MRSLQASLGLGLVASLALSMGVFWWAGSLTARSFAESRVYAQLEDDAGSVRAALADAGLGAVRLWPEYDRPASGRWFAVAYDDGTGLESRSAWEQAARPPPLVPGERSRARLEGPGGEPLLVWSGGFADGGRRYTVTVARSFEPVARLLDAVAWFFAGASLLLIATLLAVQRYVVGRTLRGLEEIRADIERLEHGRIDALGEDVPAEVRPLVAEFNRLLARFERRLGQSRNAVGNLAHALKGPLNLLVRAADERAAGAGRGDDGVRQHAERIRQLIDSELRRARLAGRTSRGSRFEPRAEIEALAGLLAQVHPERTVEVRVAVGPGVEVPHDRQDMLELLGNLLDNAFKWARSLVMVSVRSADGLLVEIEDDGAGVADGALARLGGRGVRLDESVAGHGLGLAIVREVVETYGGTLELGRSNRLGGFRAAVRLPRVPEAPSGAPSGTPGGAPGGKPDAAVGSRAAAAGAAGPAPGRGPDDPARHEPITYGGYQRWFLNRNYAAVTGENASDVAP